MYLSEQKLHGGEIVHLGNYPLSFGDQEVAEINRRILQVHYDMFGLDDVCTGPPYDQITDTLYDVRVPLEDRPEDIARRAGLYATRSAFEEFHQSA